MGSYFTLLNALAEDERLDEVEELWTKIFTENLDSTPRVFYDKMISIYHKRGLHEKMFEVMLCYLFLMSVVLYHVLQSYGMCYNLHIIDMLTVLSMDSLLKDHIVITHQCQSHKIYLPIFSQVNTLCLLNLIVK